MIQCNRFVGWASCLLLLIGASSAPALDIPARHDSWGKFKPGSWRRLRIITEKPGPAGKTTATSTTVTTRLVAVHDDGVTLTTETTIEDRTQISTVRLGWDGQPIALAAKEKLSLGEVEVQDKTYPAMTVEVVRTAPDKSTTTTKLWYCPDRSPYVLKRLVRSSQQHQSMEITKTAMPLKVLGKELIGYEELTVTASEQGRTEQTSTGSLEIPGGLVAASAEMHDRQQDLAIKTRTELEAYHIAP